LLWTVRVITVAVIVTVAVSVSVAIAVTVAVSVTVGITGGVVVRVHITVRAAGVVVPILHSGIAGQRPCHFQMLAEGWQCS